MKQLIYASIAYETVGFNTVKGILNTAHEMNFNNAITGMLVYNGEYFLQCIEGSEENVNTLFENIKKDTRHHDVKLLGVAEIPQRDFEEWTMGYMNSAKIIEDVIKEESDLNMFKAHSFNYEQAKNILFKLSFLI